MIQFSELYASLPLDVSIFGTVNLLTIQTKGSTTWEGESNWN